uniref:Transmembrane protein 41B n=1 Tax=Heterorhabditis bacteriophora TaxID=37862 RepID=A0A1I7XDC2_HETBA
MLSCEHHRPFILLGIFASFISLLLIVYLHFPDLDEADKKHLKYPRSLDDAKELGRILSHYKEQHFGVVFAGVVVVYLMLQSFAIPGSIFLTILSGYLFPFAAALLLVCTCSASGAVVCYFLSYLFGRSVVMHHFPERLNQWQEEVGKHRDNLLNYIVFLRVTPLLPNWFINIASPVLDVPVGPFFWGTFIGVAPPSFLYIQAGSTLEQMTHTNIAWNWNSIALLTFFAILSVLPVFWKRVVRDKLE